jgi:hypothetical protein
MATIPQADLLVGFVIDLEGQLYEVTAVEPFNYETGDETTAIFSSVAASGSKDFTNVTLLEPDDDPMRVYEVYWGVKTGGKYRMKLPAGTSRHGVDDDKDIGYVDMLRSPFYAPNPVYKFWLRHDRYPQMSFSNLSQEFTVTPKILFTGYKYDIKPASNEAIAAMRARGIPPKKIIVGGVKT